MKHILTILSIVFCFTITAQENNHYEQLFKEANELYQQNDIAGAQSTFESILATGINSSELYYNLANCYYKTGAIPNAILYYEKALKLTPNDPDIAFNLSLANQQTTDKIEPLPEIFYETWWNTLIRSASLHTWTILSILVCCLMAASLLLFLLSQSESLKRISFYSGIVTLLFFIVSFFAAFSLTKRMNESSTAIVFTASLNVKSAPAGNSTNLFVIHEGTKVNLLQTNGNWIEIALEDGNKGWIKKETIAEI